MLLQSGLWLQMKEFSGTGKERTLVVLQDSLCRRTLMQLTLVRADAISNLTQTKRGCERRDYNLFHTLYPLNAIESFDGEFGGKESV